MKSEIYKICMRISWITSRRARNYKNDVQKSIDLRMLLEIIIKLFWIEASGVEYTPNIKNPCRCLKVPETNTIQNVLHYSQSTAIRMSKFGKFEPIEFLEKHESPINHQIEETRAEKWSGTIQRNFLPLQSGIENQKMLCESCYLFDCIIFHSNICREDLS